MIRNHTINHAFIVMPNHLHRIIEVTVGAYGDTPLRHNGLHTGVNDSKFRSPSHTVGAIIRGFKSAATKRINQVRNTPGNPVWQRNYYEHIIRNEESYQRMSIYIEKNPLNWVLDRYYQK